MNELHFKIVEPCYTEWLRSWCRWRTYRYWTYLNLKYGKSGHDSIIVEKSKNEQTILYLN